jgi:hypothetical protein
MDLEKELEIPARRRWVSFYAAVAIAIVGALVAFLGLRSGGSVEAQFIQQLGFALFTAGVIDLLLTLGVDSLRDYFTRRQRAIAETITTIQSAMEKLQRVWEEGDDKVKRIQFQGDVLDRLHVLEDQVHNVRLKIDPEYRAARVKWAIENADRVIQESDERYERMKQDAGLRNLLGEKGDEIKDVDDSGANKPST